MSDIAVIAVFAALVLAGGSAAAGTFTEEQYAGRAYRLFVPDGPVAAPRTLVVALHGCGQTAEEFARGTRLNAAAERRGLVVVYPEQPRSGNLARCWNWFEPRHHAADRGEAAEVLGIVRDVKQRHRVRSGAIVVGLSAGGFMAVNLVCAAPGEWIGIGTMAAGPYRCGLGLSESLACMRGRAIDPAASAAACAEAGGARPERLRASLWHGAADRVVAPANLDSLAGSLARLLGVTRARTETRVGATHAEYADGAGRVRMETWVVPGVGHAWSGGDPRGSHTDPNGPDATASMLDFLLGDTGAR